MSKMDLAGLAALALLVSFGPAAAALAPCAKAPVKVGFLPTLDTDPYFTAARTGEELALKEIGGSLIQEAPSEATAEAQIPFIDSLVSQGVKVIAICADDANALVPALKRAMKHGVRVISFDSDVAPDARTLFIDEALGDSLAQMMLESMGKMIGYDGEFAILSSTATSTNKNAWIALMKSQLASNPRFAKMKLVEVAYGQESEQVNEQQALALGQAFPKLKGIIVPAGIGLPAAARALEQSGQLSHIKLTGLAPATLMKKYILAGQAQDIWWSVSNLGYLTYYAAQALAECKVTGAPGQTFTAGHLGTFTVGKDGLVILGPAQIVTPQNVNQFSF